MAGALEHGERNDTAFTPAVQVLYAFEAALDELKREGLPCRIKNYLEKSRLIEKEMEKLGVKFVVEKPYRSHVLTAFWTPPGISYEKLHDKLKHQGFVIYSGQSELKDKIFRISNLGDVSTGDLKRFLAAFKSVLAGHSL